MPRKISTFRTKEITFFFKHAQRVYKSDALTILKHSKMQPLARIVIIVPKKYGSAPERNMFKRRIRSIIREESILKDHDFAIIARPQAQLLSFDQLKDIVIRYCS